MKQNVCTNIKHNFLKLIPSVFFAIVKSKRKKYKIRICWYRRPFRRLIYRYQIKEKYKKDNNNYDSKKVNV